MNNQGLMPLITRIYQFCLHFYPGSFRQEFGREMVLIFRDSSRTEWNQRGTAALLGLWMALFLDLFATASMERLKEVFAMTNSNFNRIAGLSGILLGLIWLVVAADTASDDAILGHKFRDYLFLVFGVLTLPVIIALYLNGSLNNIAVALIAIGSIIIVLAGIIFILDVDPEEGTPFFTFAFGILLQGIGIVIVGNNMRVQGLFSGWNRVLQLLGILMVIGLALTLVIDFIAGGITTGALDLLVGFWLAAQAAAWLILGAINYVGIHQPSSQTIQSAG